MEKLIASLEHAPALVAILITIYLFLKFFRWLLESHAVRTTEFIQTVKDMHLENTQYRLQSLAVIEANTRETTKVNEALNRTSEKLDNMTNTLREFLKTKLV